MSKRFTGITPFVKTSRGLVECLPHHADYWVPVIDGSPIIVAGKALRYSKKKDALASLACAVLRRKKPDGYTLGARMAPRKKLGVK